MASWVAKVAGPAVTLACWFWTPNLLQSGVWKLALIWCAPLLQFPITFIGRRALDQQPVAKRAEWASIFVHYAMMIALGISIFPVIQRIQQRPPGVLPFPQQLSYALVWLTACATALTVLNLVLRGLGAPVAAKLSSPLATDWMYAWTRNPMLVSTLALLLSLGLKYRSLWFVVWTTLVIAPGWLFSVRVYEERELVIRFGRPYEEYRKRTPFLWPHKTSYRS
jgi:protein-S-isoprenylcysteine O-methyltransferase Ste14